MCQAFEDSLLFVWYSDVYSQREEANQSCEKEDGAASKVLEH